MELDFTIEPHRRVIKAMPLAQIYGGCMLFGWSIRETGGAQNATVIVRNGQDAGGLEVAGFQLNPSGVARDWCGDQGITTDVGIFVSITGSVTGALWVWLGEFR